MADLERSNREVLGAIHDVANCYHYIGFLIHSELLLKKKEFFDEGGETMLRVWKLVRTVIEAERERTKRSTYKQYFEQIANEFEALPHS